MKKRSLLFYGLLLGTFIGGNLGVTSAAVQNSNKILNPRLIYSSNEINEVPYFASDRVALESGDNRNDFLVIIPFDGFAISPVTYRDHSRFTELENPRPDVPDGKKIVFSAIGKNGKKGIYYIDKFEYDNANKLNATPVCLLANDHNNWQPSFNSQAGVLAYVSDLKGSPQIFIYDLKCKQSKQLTYLSQAASPFLDAKAEWLYFTGVDQKGNSDIYKVKTDGSALTRLTFDPELEKYPSLTKYGKWLVYERGTKNTRGIWLMSLDGQVRKQISDSRHWASAPCMNYDGTKIVFEGTIDNKKGIYLGEIPDNIFAGATATDFTPGIDVEKEVVNLSQFGQFNPEQLAQLSQYGFFAVPTDQKQLFYTYEQNEYKKLPSFITADNLLQLLHISFDTSLRQTEENSLLPQLTQLTQSAILELEKRKALNNDPSYITLKRYFYVLYCLVNNKPYPKATPADLQVINSELAKIRAEQSAVSSLFPQRKFDYSLFKVRGHYSNSPALSRFFRAMSWIGNINIDITTVQNRKTIYLASEILTANPNLVSQYNNIYQITAFYAGKSDDPNFNDLARYWKSQTQKTLSYSMYNDNQMQQVLKKLFADSQAKINTFYGDPQKNRTNVIGFMGQRYVADSHLFSRLFGKLGVEYLPGGLDLFAALDNQTAYQILKDETETFKKYSQYDSTLRENKELFKTIGDSENDPLFNQWTRLLKIYANSEDSGVPAVLATSHWKKKKLASTLGSWAELKHDTILYGKQTGAECGGGDEPPKVYGYIEPELTFYKALRQTIVAMDQNLKRMKAAGIHDSKQLLNLIDFFILVSEKELRQIPLSTQENEQIRIMGGLLEACTITALDARMRWWEITSESAKNMAVAADIFSFWGSYQIEAIGYADDLYIIIPVNGQLYLMRGSIFSYYEFLHNQRLTDTEWYDLLKNMKIEKRPFWWQKYLSGKKAEIPVPADPYDSGC